MCIRVCTNACIHVHNTRTHTHASPHKTLFSHRLAYCATVGATAPSTTAAELPDVPSTLACKDEVRFVHHMSIIYMIDYNEILG